MQFDPSHRLRLHRPVIMECTLTSEALQIRWPTKLKGLILGVGLITTAVLGGAALSKGPGSNPPGAGEARIAGQSTQASVWQPRAGLIQSPIWPADAPDNKGLAQKAENVLTVVAPEALVGGVSQAVFDVSQPTMTIFPPTVPGNGTAIVVFPGGGFKGVAITIEGTEICDWIASRGMTCVLSKYRVPKTGHHYDAACDCGITPRIPRALQDAQRTIRLVRARAKELNINPNKIGAMGFSAGGYLVVQASNVFAPAYKPVDEVDKASSRPDFAVAFFPGHICRDGDRLDPGLNVTPQAPPTFLLQAWDDPVNPVCNSTLYARELDAHGVSAEIHLFASGGHAFGLRRKRSPDSAWPPLLENWLNEIGMR